MTPETRHSVLVRIANDDEHLRDIFDLDHATNDRPLAENGRLPAIGPHELVFGIPYFRIVNAAFTHAHPLGEPFQRTRPWCVVRRVRAQD